MKISKCISVTAAFLSAALVVSACGSSDSDSKSGDVTIGMSVPTTGDAASLATSMTNAAKLAVSDANATGGLPGKVKLVVEDDQMQPAVAASVARKFCGDKNVIGSISQFASSVTLASQPIYNRCGMAQISPTASNDTLTTKGYDNYFRVTAKNVDTVIQSLEWVQANWPDVKTVATVDTNDSSTRNASSQFAERAEGAGLSVATSIHVTTGQADFRGALTGLLAKKPDLIYLSTFFNDGALVVKQARQLGYAGQFIGIDALLSDEFGKIAGADAAEGVVADTLGLSPEKNPGAADFVKAYTGEYGTAPDSSASQTYDAVMTLIDAWKRAGSADRKAIIKAIRKTSFDGVSGHISFDENGDIRDPQVGIEVVKDGKFEYYGPARG
jgi:branched-chain amino acid transport system substrate-binding protein